MGMGLALFLLVGGLMAGCKERVAGSGEGGVLPAGEWSDWKPEAKIMEYGREDLSEYLGGAAARYLAYDFRRLWVRPYHKPNGHALTAELYDLSTPAEAFGVFSWDWKGEAIDIPGAQALYTQGALKLWKGKYYLWLVSSTKDDRYKEDLIALAEWVARQLAPGLSTPPLLRRLPKEGLEEKSIFYFHRKPSLDSKIPLGRENLLRLSRKTNGLLASYRLPEGDANLLLVEYPEEADGKALLAFRREHFRSATQVEEGPEAFIAETRSGVYDGIAPCGKLIAIVLNGERPEVCRRLLSAVKASGE